METQNSCTDSRLFFEKLNDLKINLVLPRVHAVAHQRIGLALEREPGELRNELRVRLPRAVDVVHADHHVGQLVGVLKTFVKPCLCAT